MQVSCPKLNASILNLQPHHFSAGTKGSIVAAACDRSQEIHSGAIFATSIPFTVTRACQPSIYHDIQPNMQALMYGGLLQQSQMIFQQSQKFLENRMENDRMAFEKDKIAMQSLADSNKRVADLALNATSFSAQALERQEELLSSHK